jgi:YYY domain-containing protein
VVFDWLAREGGFVFSWWALVTLAGAAVMPLCARLLGALPDKGYTLARAAGLLVTGYVFWILASLGFLQNTAGSMALAWVIVAAFSLAVYFQAGQSFDWGAWWRENKPVVILAEALFLVAFFAWAIVRAHQPELRTTEKPMDLMMISSIMRSPVFPPNDGWMAGYSISYYYFGYLMAAMLSTLSGVQSTVGFNLMNALLFALTGLTAFGVAYNLARSQAVYDDRADAQKRAHGTRPAMLAGVTALVTVTLMGNFQMALIEFPYQTRTASEWYLRFTGTQARDVYPEREAGTPDDQPVGLSPGISDPTQWEAWWWFRASRVLNDFRLDGSVDNRAQPIDEFPQFSFLLSDNHPHVMAMPFVLLAIGLALNLVLTARSPHMVETVFYALCLGGLIFLNTWDGPIYILALVGAEGLRRLMAGQGRITRMDVVSLVGFGAAVTVLALIFYLPFLISFRSQASGILPNVIYPTLFQQFFIMFGPFLLILGFFLVSEASRAGRRMNALMGLQVASWLFVGLFVILIVLIAVASVIPELYNQVLQFAAPYGGLGGAILPVLRRRLETLPTTLVLLASLVLIVGRLFPRVFLLDVSASREERMVVTYSPATGFALLLTAVGVMLTLVPEFFYLRDNFGTRINTIFKFYLQTWMVWGIASAYAIYALLSNSRSHHSIIFRMAFAVTACISLALGLLYPIFGIYSRAYAETGLDRNIDVSALSLDGGPKMMPGNRADYDSILCWQKLVGDRQMIVAEALGGAYDSAFGRVAGLTGAPIVLGWENHESQWRGSTYPQVVGSRGQDIPALYSDLRWETAQQIIQRYGIDYIFYGQSERAKYSSAGEEKFIENLEAVCPITDGNGRIVSVFYRVTDRALQATFAGSE